MTRITVLTLSLVPIFYLFLGGVFGGEEQKQFGDQSPKEQIATMEGWTKRQNEDLAAFTEYFTKNWDKELPATAAFCKLAGASRTTEAIPLLVAHLDFRYLGEGYDAGPLRGPLEDRQAMDALIKIGIVTLEPSIAQIIASLDALPEKEDRGVKFRRVFLHEALKAVPMEILGKDLTLAYLKMKLENKELSTQVRAHLEAAIKEIETGKYCPPSERTNPPASGGNP